MKILMLNPPFLPKFSRSSRSPAVAKGGTIYYPLWLAYATGALEKEGHEVKLIDAPARGIALQEVLDLAQEFKPELTVLDSSTASIHNDINVLEKIKEKTKTFAVLVGPHVSATAEETLKQSKKIDAIARKEYDYTLKELASELEKKNPKLEKIAGISYWKNNRIIHNKERGLIQNLDEIPFVSEVYKRHLRIENYFYAANLYPEVTIVSGRGCNNRCAFCVWPQTMMGRTYRSRSVKNLVSEFEFIKKNFPQAKEIFIEDDTFTSDRQRVKEFCKQLIEKNLKMVWSCNARADVDLETLEWMKKAGCRLMCVGFESGVQEILNNIHKGTTIEKIRQFMKDSKKAKIKVHGCFILGNQGETKETIRKTIDFAKELDPDTAQFFPIMVYPGTETFDWAKKNGYLLTNDYSKWLNAEGMHNTLVSRPGLSNKELVELCDQGRKEFYLRKKFIASKLKQAITEPKEIPRLMKAGKTFAKHLMKK